MKTAQEERRPSAEPVACPRCGGAMNRHAEKVVFGGDPGESSERPGFDGAVDEFHTCPACRYILERRTM
ncbi:MAG TPA: hypothetical protein VE007_10630 [Thermoanaerobaculia bacterium]|nr:hypothetical protein [Thermoanaerobaculia bacterium]